MNAELILPLDKMTAAEKMEVIDRIMDDLSRNSSSVPVVEWHGEVLRQRAQDHADGNDRFIPLDEAVKRTRHKSGR
ncbi:MAG: addiction module protein [Blastocatellia bacterium]|nr:addiction module protein [Blastocatellia bacterium]